MLTEVKGAMERDRIRNRSPEQLMKKVLKDIKRVYWTNEEIDEKLGKRSAEQIWRERNTFYMNPCLDFALAFLSEIQKQTDKTGLAIEEHGKTPDFPFNRLHFVVEFENSSGLYHANFKNSEEIELNRGNYFGRTDIPQIQLFRIPGERIRPDIPLHQSLGHTTLDEAIGSMFKGYKFSSQVRRLKRDNTPERFKKYQKAHPPNPKSLLNSKP